MSRRRSRFIQQQLQVDAYVRRWRDRYVQLRTATFDFESGLADVYARAGVARPGAPDDEAAHDLKSPALTDVCDHIDMLDALLGEVTDSRDGPAHPAGFFHAARMHLVQLRAGLVSRQLTREDAVRLVHNVRHALRETDRAIREQLGLSLEQAISDRLGEMRNIETDLTAQMSLLEQKVMRLFEPADELEPKFVPQP